MGTPRGLALLMSLIPSCALWGALGEPAGKEAGPIAWAAPMPSVSRTPAPWEGPDQAALPLPVVRGSQQPVVDIRAERTESVLPASIVGAKLVASGGRTLYASRERGSIDAIDAGTGAIRWHADHVVSDTAAASDTLVFVNSEVTSSAPASYALTLAASDGSRVAARPGYWAGATLHGFYYASGGNASHAESFAAYDARTGREVWSTIVYGGVGGPPTQVGAMLLQSFWESGAILTDAMHAFDVVTGRELWRRGYGPRPLGSDAGVVYLDTTWFPIQREDYAPLGIGTVDLTTGTLLHEYYYKPDRARNWPSRTNAPVVATGAHVGGGFVTFEINHTWYRYDADRDPYSAHAVRLDGIDDVAAWLTATRALVTANGGTTLAHWLPDRIELQPLGDETLRSPVTAADDGTRYAVVGTRLLAIDPDGSRVRALGAVPCDAVVQVIALRASVGVRCRAARAGSGERLIRFADPVGQAVGAFAQPKPPPPARFALSLTRNPVPPAGPSPIERQWWPSSLAAGPHGTLAVALTPGGAIDRSGAIARVTPSGAVDVVRVPERDGPVRPHDVIIDGHGTIWFNDDLASTVTSLRPDGTLRTLQIGALPDPTPTPAVIVTGGRPIGAFARRARLGIRLAVGPDGEAWYARSHPTRTIGRIDGTRAFPVSDAVGDVLALAGGHDGALWFLTSDAVGRLALDGTFARVAFPESFRRDAYPQPRLVPGRANTVWITAGKQLAEVDAHRVLRTWSLPNASSTVAGLAVGCDGTVYAADTLGPQLARFAPDGSIEEHQTDLFTIDALATASDCRLWFVGGSNAPNQEVGTFSFKPR